MTPTEISLWPDLKVEGSETTLERGTAEHPNRMIRGEITPSLTVFLPEKNPTGAAVILCPGGGYWGLAVDLGGYEIARWLQARGIAGLVLKYRFPVGVITGEPLPMQDARRALQLTRANAEKWRLRADRIGMMGFSAGGHLAASTATLFEPAERPNFLILSAPVISMRDEWTNEGTRKSLMGPEPREELQQAYSPELHVSAQTPPTFVVHAQDDTTAPLAGSELFISELQKQGIPATLFAPREGGHLVYLNSEGEAGTWSQKLEKWLGERGLMTTL